MHGRGLKSLGDLDDEEGSNMMALLGDIPVELKQTLINNLYSVYNPDIPFWKSYDLNHSKDLS